MDSLQHNLDDLIHNTMYKSLWPLWPVIKRSVTPQVWDTIVNRYPSNFISTGLNLKVFVFYEVKSIADQYDELQQR